MVEIIQPNTTSDGGKEKEIYNDWVSRSEIALTAFDSEKASQQIHELFNKKLKDDKITDAKLIAAGHKAIRKTFQQHGLTDPFNTVKRDEDYGPDGNEAYAKANREEKLLIDALKKATPEQAKELKTRMQYVTLNDAVLKGLSAEEKAKIEHIAIATREGVEDAYLQAHLPSPFPQMAPQKSDILAKK